MAKRTDEELLLYHQQKAEQVKNRIKQKEKKMKQQERKKENHIKMVLGGAFFGVFKNNIPTERNELDLYGRAVQNVYKRVEGKLNEYFQTEYNKLVAENLAKTDLPEPTSEETE